MKIETLPLLLLLIFCSVAISAEQTKQYRGAGDHWLHIDYPGSFASDPRNDSGEEGWLWRDRFSDPASKLSVDVFTYGYISSLDLLLTIPGFTYSNYEDKLRIGTADPDKRTREELIASEAMCKTAGQYFKEKMAPKGSELSRWPGYERYIHITKSKVTVYFLGEQAYKETDGQLFQMLIFTFPEGTYVKHQPVIERIIKSARPKFTKKANKAEMATPRKPSD